MQYAVLTDRHEVAIYDRTLQVEVPSDLINVGPRASECGRELQAHLSDSASLSIRRSLTPEAVLSAELSWESV